MNRRERKLQARGEATPEMAAHVAQMMAYPIACHRAGRLDRAAAGYRQIIKNEPDCADAWCNLGNVLAELGHYGESIAASQRAIELNPKIPDAHNNLGAAFLRHARVNEAFACYLTAHQLTPKTWPFARNLLACSLYRDDLDVDQVNTLHQRVAKNFQVYPFQSFEVRRPGPIRVGFVSSDLRNHVLANILLPLVKRLDAAKFELSFWAHDSAVDATTAEYGERGSIYGIDDTSDARAAEMMRSKELDIAVFCAGHLDRNRPTIACHRAAPVQISMFDVHPTFLPGMDYYTTDSVLTPAERSSRYVERPLYIDPVYVVDGLNGYPPVLDTPRTGPPVFGCFNNPCKISRSCLEAWAAILTQVPNSVIKLGYNDCYASEELRDRFTKTLRSKGAGENQIWFYVDNLARDQHLQRYNEIDIALDTFPFSGSTTSFQAAAMGVPVVTLAGDRMSGRWTYSMVEACQRHQLDVSDAVAYSVSAVDCATHVDVYRLLRSDIRRLVVKSPLCDPGAYAAKVAQMFTELVK